MNTKYDAGFYQGQEVGSRASAQCIVPIVLKLIGPASILDVGCGIGTWLKVFSENGVQDYLGVDGDYVNRNQLQIDAARFRPTDLQKPFSVDRSFDLVTCFEVAEHLPASAAAVLVKSLVAHAPMVLFSAAIPRQGGTMHVNEQWQNYWADHFASHDYVAVDCIRRHVWSNPQVEAFYAQNILLFAKRDLLQKIDWLQAEYTRTFPELLSIVHPAIWMYNTNPEVISTRTLLKLLPGKIVEGIRYRFRRRFKPGSFPAPTHLVPAKF
jgi:SAM-dependent methyltransferase